MHRPNKGGRLEDRVGKNQVVLSYAGLDNIIRQTCIRFDPVPKKISPSGLQFEMLVTRMREDAPRILDALRNSLKHRPSAFRSPSSLDFFQLRWADGTRDALGKTEGFAARFLVYVSSGKSRLIEYLSYYDFQKLALSRPYGLDATTMCKRE